MVSKLMIGKEDWLEISNFHEGLYLPATTFHSETEYRSIVDECRLPDGSPWTVPLTLAVPEDQRQEIEKSESIDLYCEDVFVASMKVSSFFFVDSTSDVKKIYKTDSLDHPGVNKEVHRSPYRVSGDFLLKKKHTPKNQYGFELTPSEAKKEIQSRFKTCTGFQTRNPLHLGHEWILRNALEMTDGLLIHPVVGWKKKGDFSPVAVSAGYQEAVKNFIHSGRVILSFLRIPMKYAGPREAVFHALVRKNFGCTHFVVGRDHAGVGSYYGWYEAQDFIKSFKNLGIKVFCFGGPRFCMKCNLMVSEKSCPHTEEDLLDVSGTGIRKLLSEGKLPDPRLMRPEVAQAILTATKDTDLFVQETGWDD